MANREARRKNKTYQEKRVSYSSNNEMRNLLICILVIVGIFAAVYLLSVMFIDNNKGYDKKIPTATIQYENILYTNIFNRQDKEYYVMLYDFDDLDAKTYDYIYSMYKQKTTKLATYVVNLGDKLNSSIVVDEKSNKKPTKPSELKVIAPTLIKIKDGKVVSYIEGTTKIAEALK